MRPVTAAATFCATLVDEWQRLGVTDAVVCPGSRSTPMALAIAESPLRLHVHHDERSAAFVALGIGLASGRPAVVLTTSGTATVNLHPAVVEADLAGVPMIVCTADRPSWLQDRGAPQTIRQTDLYGHSVRSAHDPGVPDEAAVAEWRPLATRVHSDSSGSSGRPGPVHLNLAFDEPLTGSPDQLPPTLRTPDDPAGQATQSDELVDAGLLERPEGLAGRGIIISGRSDADVEAVRSLANSLGWPVVAEPRSGSREVADIVHADVFLRHLPTAESLRPQAVLRIGEPPASRVLNEWIAASGAYEVVLADRFIDPWRSADQVLQAPGSLVGAWAAEWSADPTDPAWLERWTHVESVTRAEIARLADSEPLNEIGVARTVMAETPSDAAIVVSSSMPVRDLEWYSSPRADAPVVLSNRGANGIDGVTSTAVGVALTGQRTVALLGDVAFLHDGNGLLGLAGREVDLAIVVIDNDGGGIFSFLPQAKQLATGRFEQLFGTPHGVDLPALIGAHGLDSEEVSTRAALAEAINRPGVHVVVVRSDRGENAALHRLINQTVAESLGD